MSEQDAMILQQAQEILNKYSLHNKKIYIEDTSGDALFIIQVSEQGVIIRMDNCEIADMDTDSIRLQQIREVK